MRQYYSLKEYLLRLLWSIFSLFFRFSPRPFWFFRAALLRLFGASVGLDTRIYPSVMVSQPWNLTVGSNVRIGPFVRLYCLGMISISDSVVISQYSHICAGSHDYNSPEFPVLKLPIRIHSHVWIASDAFIGPSVVVGSHSIVAARSVVVSFVNPHSIVGGNPAKLIKPCSLNIP